jgi:hypothetical protein
LAFAAEEDPPVDVSAVAITGVRDGMQPADAMTAKAPALHS